MTAALVAAAWAGLVLILGVRTNRHAVTQRLEWRRPSRAETDVAAVAGRALTRTVDAIGAQAMAIVGARPDRRRAERVGRAVLAAGVVLPVSRVGALAVAVVAAIGPEFRRDRQSARAIRNTDAAVPEVAELLLLGLRAGASPRRAIEVAAEWAPPEAAALLASVVRGVERGRTLDEALHLLQQEGPRMGRLGSLLSSGLESGTPLQQPLADLAADGRRAARHRAEVEARRLPVLLLFPLTCCILPAFGLLTVGPALAAGLRSLQP
ncbi:MAG: type II secretion system F family protein [Acidimicrobiales bacterium]